MTPFSAAPRPAGLRRLAESARWGIAILSLTLAATVLARTEDLPGGLTYLRIKNLDTDAIPAARAALVLDLRGTLAEERSIHRLDPLLEARAPGSIRLILVDATTTPAVLARVNQRRPHVLTLGAATPGLTTDIAVATAVETDRRAQEAIDDGKPLESLLDARREKRRYDEAAMVRDHANGIAVPESPPDALPTPPADPAAKPTPTPLNDSVLQRAIHVYHALQALKKL